ncbi:hypothetical protein RRG08_028599 [Elysia crispata]|uniref:Uncharacterized protein n=1 Tax=Elysia crispata TaxID=231223 RepID=A0AAE0ZUP7_9GAST|nr:hypothetical protein RRG08_028599 [Elysia crispata]
MYVTVVFLLNHLRQRVGEILPFPTVTICSLSELDTRKANHLQGVTNASEKLFSLFATESLVSGQLDALLSGQTYDDILGLTIQQIVAEASIRLEDLLVYCSYESIPFRSGSKLKRDEQYPHCFHFNANTASGMWTRSVGATTGLRVILRIDE